MHKDQYACMWPKLYHGLTHGTTAPHYISVADKSARRSATPYLPQIIPIGDIYSLVVVGINNLQGIHIYNTPYTYLNTSMYNFLN